MSVAPLSVLSVWAQEITDRCNKMKYLVFHPTGKESRASVPDFSGYDVVISNYHTLARADAPFSKICWRVSVCYYRSRFDFFSITACHSGRGARDTELGHPGAQGRHPIDRAFTLGFDRDSHRAYNYLTNSHLVHRQGR